MTHRIRSKWGLGLLALMLLSLGLAGCGSDEPMATTPTPPAPTPAPTPMDQTVTLGQSGSSVTLVAAGGGYTLDGAAFTGGEVQAANGATYALTLEGGTWSAMHVAQSQEVALGDSGNAVTIEQLSEDGAWTIGGMVIMSGGMTTDEGVSYQLTLADGMWSATAGAMSIAGTDLTAVPRADGSGYEVRRGDLVLDATLMFGDDNTGEIMVGSMGYLVTKDAEDGSLSAARFIAEPGAGSAIGYGAANGDPLGAPSLQDGGTMLQLGDIKFPVGELLDTGMTRTEDTLFIAGQLETIEAVRGAAADLDALDEELLPSSALALSLAPMRERVNEALAEMFGEGAFHLQEGEPEEFVEELDLILAALADEEAFVAAATAADGLFAALGLDEMAARAAYNTRKSAGTVTLASTGSTSYGTVIAQVFASALDDTPDRTIGAYAYSSLPGTLRTSHVLRSGLATYAGATQAVGGSGTLYEGTIEVQVGFTSSKASAVLRDMVKASGDEAGEPLAHLGETVRAIFLPLAPMARNTAWSVEDGDARVVYRVRPGITTLESTSSTADFAGRLLGRGEESGSEAAGTWSLGDPAATDDTYLVGAFGAVRGEGAAIMPGDLDFSNEGARAASGQYTFADSSIVNPVSSNTEGQWFTENAGAHQTNFRDGILRLHAVEPRRYLFGNAMARWDNVVQRDEYEVDGTRDNGARFIAIDIPIEDMEFNGEVQQFEYGPHFYADSLEVLEEALSTLERFQALDSLDDAELTATLEASGTVNVWRDAGDALYRVIGGQIDGFGDGDATTDDLATTAENLDARVTLLENVLAALASESTLAAAFEEGGLFSDVSLTSVAFDHQLIDNDGVYRTRFNTEGDYSYEAADLLEHRAFRLSLAMEATDYTRYGLWFYQARAGANSLLEHRYGPVYDREDRNSFGWNANGPSAVAYTPLGRLFLPVLNEETAPFLGGTATYRGGALGIFGDSDNVYDMEHPMEWIRSDVTVVIDWTPPPLRPLATDPDSMGRHDPDGSLMGTGTITFENLMTPDGRRLVWSTGMNADGEDVIGSTTEVGVPAGRIRDIVFTGLDIDRIPAAGYGDSDHLPPHTVLLEWHADNNNVAADNNNIRIRFEDPSRPDVIPTRPELQGGIINGDFGGASPDGPMAIVGVLNLAIGQYTSGQHTGDPAGIADVVTGYHPGIGIEALPGNDASRAWNHGQPLVMGWGAELP